MSHTLTPTAAALLQQVFLQPNWLIESQSLDFHYYSYDTTGLTGTWEPRIMSLPILERSATPGGGITSTASFRAVVIDDGQGQSLSALADQGVVLLGADIEFSLLLPGELYADRIRLFTGVLSETEHVGATQTIYAIDPTLRTNRTYPRFTVERTQYPDAPDASIGQRIPLLYGDSVEMDAAPLLHIDVPKRRYFLAGHPVESFQEQYGVWPEAGSRYVTRTGLAITDPAAPQATLSLAVDLTQIRFGETLGSLSISRHAGNLVDPNWAIDGNPVTQPHLMLVSVPSGDDTLCYVAVQAIFAQPNPTHLNTLYVTSYRDPVVITDDAGANVRIIGSMIINVLDDTSAVLRQLFQVTYTQRAIMGPANTPALLESVYPIQALATNERIELYLEAKITNGAGSASDLASSEINTIILARHVDSEFTPLYATGFRGKQDDSFGTITGTPNAVIENCADVTRDIIVNEIGDPVDATDFDNARAFFAARNMFFDGGIGAGYHTQEVDKQSMLRDLGRQSRSYISINGHGEYSIKPYDRLTPTVLDFDENSILANADPVDGALPPNAQSTLRITRGRLDTIYNEFEIHYHWHAGKQRLDRVAFVRDGLTSHPDPTIGGVLVELASDSISRYGETETFRLDAYWIARDVTANALLEHYVTYFWSEALFVSFETYYVATAVTIGDNITITHPRLPAIDNGGVFEVVRATRQESRRRIAITARKVAGVLAQYFQMLDQNGRVWYWWINDARELVSQATVPDEPDRIFRDIQLSPTPSWLELVEVGTSITRYVYPEETGTPLVEPAAPPNGVGYIGSPAVRIAYQGQWELQVVLPREIEAIPA